jgi:hypothetical protein
MEAKISYTADEVLQILRTLWPLADGDASDGDDFPAITLRDWDDWAIVLDWWCSARYRKREYAQALQTISDMFGFAATEEECEPLAQGRTTMREIAEFIAARAPYRDFAPVTILGKRCPEAGIFRELEHSTEWILGQAVRVGPSTRLDAVLSKQQRERLAGRLRVLFRGLERAPELWRKSVLGSGAWWSITLAMVCAIVGTLLAAIGAEFPVILGGFCSALGLCMVPVFVLLAIAAGVASIGKGPFDRGIKTYRDLVNVLKTEVRRSWAT